MIHVLNKLWLFCNLYIFLMFPTSGNSDFQELEEKERGFFSPCEPGCKNTRGILDLKKSCLPADTSTKASEL